MNKLKLLKKERKKNEYTASLISYIYAREKVCSTIDEREKATFKWRQRTFPTFLFDKKYFSCFLHFDDGKAWKANEEWMSQYLSILTASQFHAWLDDDYKH